MHTETRSTRRDGAHGVRFRWRVQPCPTRPIFVRTAIHAQSPSARRLARDSGFISQSPSARRLARDSGFISQSPLAPRLVRQSGFNAQSPSAPRQEGELWFICSSCTLAGVLSVSVGRNRRNHRAVCTECSSVCVNMLRGICRLRAFPPEHDLQRDRRSNSGTNYQRSLGRPLQ
jgi:hypothetical protein